MYLYLFSIQFLILSFFFLFLMQINYMNGSQPIATTSNAINLYDSGWTIENACFENYNVSAYTIFRPFGAAMFSTHTRTSGFVLRNSKDILFNFIIHSFID